MEDDHLLGWSPWNPLKGTPWRAPRRCPRSVPGWHHLSTPGCLGDQEMARFHGDVMVIFCGDMLISVWFHGGFMVMSFMVVLWWFNCDCMVILWWLYCDFIVIFWWCYECDDFIISFWWFYGDVMVISWWLFGDFNPIHFNGMVYGIRFTLGSINWSRQWLTNMLLAFTVESLNPSLWACW